MSKRKFVYFWKYVFLILVAIILPNVLDDCQWNQ